MKKDWTPVDIPDLTGKVAVVTGANIGLGLEIARRLAQHNATTILACRNLDKANTAKEALLSELGREKTIFTMKLDVSSFASVKQFAQDFKQCYDRLDIMMCNAGVMALQERHESVDGFELQLATNHLGHFLLVGELMSILAATPSSRVVTQSSSAGWYGKFNWDDINATQKYERWAQYCFTKTANVAFVNELNRRLKEAGISTTAYSCHPGYVVGQLQQVSAGSSILDKVAYKVTSLLAGTYETGALPALFACTSEEAQVGELYGPNGFYNGIFSGKHPKAVYESEVASDSEAIKRLWEASEEMTGIKYSFEL